LSPPPARIVVTCAGVALLFVHGWQAPEANLPANEIRESRVHTRVGAWDLLAVRESDDHLRRVAGLSPDGIAGRACLAPEQPAAADALC
jgi:hypothetical protein